MHGSAPKYAGRDVANPTALILTAALMLRHLGEDAAAEAVEQAVAVTLEAGTCTADAAGAAQPVSTTAFAEAVAANLGRISATWRQRPRQPLDLSTIHPAVQTVPARREVVGVDVFVESTFRPEELGTSIASLLAGTRLGLKMISNCGTKVYPPTGALTDCVDHWRCRFLLAATESELRDDEVTELLTRLGKQHRWMHVEKLQQFDGAPGFTKAQGEN